MKQLLDVLADEPAIFDDECGYALRWGDDLCVIIIAGGRIGQFAASERWSRCEIEHGVKKHLDKLAANARAPTPDDPRGAFAD